jgi:lysophospholipase-2
MRIESDGSDGTITIWPDEGNHSATVIVMHGLGDSADGWSSTAEALAQQYPYIKFLLPTAERLPVTINGGARIPAWFDITGLEEEHHASTPSIRPAAERIRKLFDAEISSGIQPNRISLMGFSQGGAMAIYVGLQLPVDLKPAGVIALSGFIPDHTNLTVTDGLADVPVLQCHGTADPVVMYNWALKSKEYLTEKVCIISE